jgi:hypothetical protein
MVCGRLTSPVQAQGHQGRARVMTMACPETRRVRGVTRDASRRRIKRANASEATGSSVTQATPQVPKAESQRMAPLSGVSAIGQDAGRSANESLSAAPNTAGQFKADVKAAWAAMIAGGMTPNEAEAALRRAWNVAIREAWEQRK